MNLSQNTQAILLLTGYFNPSTASSVKPLTVGEWSRFAEFLKNKTIQPSQLLKVDCLKLLDGFSDKTVTIERVDTLLKRGTAMAVALEKWSRSSIWVISRADKEYPERLKKKLGHSSPPILYGCGNKALLNKGGVGVVGSRTVSEDDLSYTKHLGTKVAISGFSIVSGGAKGVDQAAMLSALDVDGTVIGILADSLFRACSSRQYRQHIMNNNLVLITPFYPEAGFNAGNAMQRNKYIYCLSDATVVVHSGNPNFSKNGKGGGTWTGALENLKKAWVPLWVKQTSDTKAGNALIVMEGGQWLSEDIDKFDIENLIKSFENNVEVISNDIFSQDQTTNCNEQIRAEKAINDPARETSDNVEESADNKTERLPLEAYLPENFYEYFLMTAQPLLAEAKEVDQLVEKLELNKSQLNVWLKQAVKDKKILKLSKPIRYEWNEAGNKQGTLL
jgi:predicted Rossmann fold nucleotide-binding protein DprA/Smf involved in DNA uptake